MQPHHGGSLGSAPQLRKRGYGVEGRLGIGHTKDGRESPRRRSRGSGRHSFLPFLSRLTQVDMNIDETRGDDETTDIEDALARFRVEISDLANDSRPDTNIAREVKLLARIDNVPAAHQETPRRHAISRMEKDRPTAHVGPKDGLAAREHVMNWITDLLDSDVPASIGMRGAAVKAGALRWDPGVVAGAAGLRDRPRSTLSIQARRC
jgi:hypothetical protein